MMIDIDYFKQYNDNYSHMDGDEVLKKVANAIDTTLGRSYDLVARYGGEEFIVLLNDINPEYSTTLAQRIKDAIDTLRIPHKFSPLKPYITVSIGVSTTNHVGGYLCDRNFLCAVDKCLYEAKHNGRDCIVSKEFLVDEIV